MTDPNRLPMKNNRVTHATRIHKKKPSLSDGSNSSKAQLTKRIKIKHKNLLLKLDQDLDQRTNVTIGRMDERLLADYVAQSTRRFETNLSPLELQDLYIPESAFLNTSGWTGSRVLEGLPDFLEYCDSLSGNLSRPSAAPLECGAPHTIIITSSGMRAADTVRVLRRFKSEDAQVAKLFGKHIKLKNATEYVKKTKMGFGVGTPGRLIDLLNAGALSLENVMRVVVDCSHVDQKKRGVFDMIETQRPLVRLLNRRDLKSRYGSDGEKVRLMLY